jgi:hypothetical protein
MAATASEVSRLRRWLVEPTADTFSDTDLSAAIERHPLPDAAGLQPTDADWTPVYDLHAAASDLWAEKAGALAGAFDFSADGATFNRSQAYDHARRQAAYHAARRAARAVPFSAASAGEITDG